MSGRFFRRGVTWEQYRDAVGLIPPPPEVLPPEATYNAAPMSFQPIIIPRKEGGTAMLPALWGLVPGWWTKPLSEKKFSSFNADAETVHFKPVYRGAFRHHRCLVPVSGFYAWTGEAGAKQPWAISLKDRGWFCLAGLWDTAMIDGSEFDSFTILTTTPNDLMAGLSTRMPVILKPDQYDRWLDASDTKTRHLYTPYPSDEMQAWAVSAEVGNVRNNHAGLIVEV